MAEYIEREALLRDIEEAMKFRGLGCIAATAMERYIKRQTAADVVEVRHGRWVNEESPLLLAWKLRCSVCNDTFVTQKGPNYCPNCGARMDGGGGCLRLMSSEVNDMADKNISILRPCAKCGEVKEVCCLIDGKPWCEDCFIKALGTEGR